MILGGERGPHEIVEERRSTINFHNLAKAKTLKMKAITKIMLPTDGLTNQLTRGTKKKYQQEEKRDVKLPHWENHLLTVKYQIRNATQLHGTFSAHFFSQR